MRKNTALILGRVYSIITISFVLERILVILWRKMNCALSLSVV